MVEKIKTIPLIDVFVLVITGDRLENNALIKIMKTYELMFGGRAAWDNIALVISKIDFNIME